MREDLLTHVDKRSGLLCVFSTTYWADRVKKKKLIDIGFRLDSSMDKGNHVMDGLTRG